MAGKPHCSQGKTSVAVASNILTYVFQLSWYCSWLSKNYSSSDSSTHNHPAHSAEAFWLQDELENRIDPFQSHTWRQFQQLAILLNWGWVFCGQVKVIKFEPTASSDIWSRPCLDTMTSHPETNYYLIICESWCSYWLTFVDPRLILRSVLDCFLLLMYSLHTHPGNPPLVSARDRPP